MNIFEQASRKNLTFNSFKGLLNVSDLFQLTLLQLDEIAKRVNSFIINNSEQSFIDEKSPDNTEFELRLDILKFIIADKQKMVKENENRFERSERRRKILEVLADKEDAALGKKSKATLLKELEELTD